MADEVNFRGRGGRARETRSALVTGRRLVDLANMKENLAPPQGQTLDGSIATARLGGT